MDDRDTKQSAGYFKQKAIIAWSSIKGDQVDKAIQKVTSHMLKAPKEKYLYLLIGITFKRNGVLSKNGKPICQYILHQLQKRSHTHNWIVVLKTLVTLHRLMQQGSQDFLDCLLMNNNIFSFRLKDIAEDFDSTYQHHFIEEYMNYLQEKRQMQLLIGPQFTVQTIDFEQQLKKYTIEMLLPLCIAMTRTIQAIGNIVFRDNIVNNFCTLQAHELLIRDGKRLIQILSKQMIIALEKFDYLPTNQQSAWLQQYEMYSDAVNALKHFFDCLTASCHAFSQYIPSLKPLPESMIKHLRQVIRLSNVEKQVCTLESLKLDLQPKRKPSVSVMLVQQKEGVRINSRSNDNKQEQCIQLRQVNDDDNDIDYQSKHQQAQWSQSQNLQIQKQVQQHQDKAQLLQTLPDLLLFQGKTKNDTNTNINTNVNSRENEQLQQQIISTAHTNSESNPKNMNKVNLDELFQHVSQLVPNNVNFNNKWNAGQTSWAAPTTQTFSTNSETYHQLINSNTLEKHNCQNMQQWSSGAPHDYIESARQSVKS